MKNTKNKTTDNGKLPIHGVSYSDLSFYGKKITDLTREELYKGIEWLYNENERYRKMYDQSNKGTIKLMDDVINMKRESL